MWSKLVIVLFCVSFCIQISSGSNNRHRRVAKGGCGPPPLISNARTRKGKQQIYAECDSNYRFSNNQSKIELHCDVNVWKLRELGAANQFECKPFCNPPCQHGECVIVKTDEPGNCYCEPNFDGMQCENKKGDRCKAEPDITNANNVCTQTKCQINCATDYEFSDGFKDLEMICNGGQWEPNRANKVIPTCNAICVKPCKNNGKCITPGVCKCKGNFVGEQCENEKCGSLPTILNSNPAVCNETNCEIECMGGYAFPDRTNTVKMICKNGLWKSSRSDAADCEPFCVKRCLNGGTCSKPGICTCLDGFKGAHCEQKTTCRVKPTTVNAKHNCKANSCKITCDNGHVLPDGSSVMKMDCKNGKWESSLQKQNFAPDCQSKCGAGLMYNKCGPNVEPTCDNAEERSVCVPGCFCPNGMVKHEGKCIQSEDCPCTSNGLIFKPGSETITLDEASSIATTCKCEKGDVTCKPQPFTRKRCTVAGDPHFSTFDGAHYDYMGTGAYRLLDTDNMEITANFVQCFSTASCVESVTIEVKNGNKKAKIVLKRNLVVEVNGQEISNFPSYALGDYVLITLPSSTKISVALKNGFRIFYDGLYNVDVDAISLYNGKMVGLCESNGPHERNKRSTEGNEMNSWIGKLLHDSCIEESCNTIDEALNSPHPCDSNVEVKQRAEKACAQLKSDIFATCHPYVDPKPYYDNCLYDVCAFNDDIDTWMCSIFTSYANECSRRGNVLEHWRQSIQGCAIKCPKGQIYEECSRSCYRSCDDLQLSSKNCTRDCVDGCRCPEGQALDGNNKCIPIDMCHSSCKPIPLEEATTVGIVQLVGEVYGKCVNTEPIRGYTECRGTCGPVTSSTGLTSRKSPKHKCCLMSKYDKVRVPLVCDDGTKLTSFVYMPIECVCHSCSYRWAFLQ
ncbi:kielin/chordin-like protein [Sitodiplosis mosellana]|uniref:kielin/chordin-like protein n=1 Tax=Sitodiplosis mosellana TaxID=263140 RepID=UPI0024451E79|nr:kielin/chordin-like protein [Sitodiplosis mosellana]